MTTFVTLDELHRLSRQYAVPAIAHNLTAATRLFDVLHLLATERPWVAFNCSGSSAFQDGAPEDLAGRCVRYLP